MSWKRNRPVISRAEARAKLPPGACRRCVLFMRKSNSTKRLWLCSRCMTFYGANYTMDFFGRDMLTPNPKRVNYTKF